MTSNQVLTIPNVISVIRIAGIPLFLWLLLARDDATAAAWALGAIGTTDWVDGYLARRLDQVSELGKLLDPIADRLAIGSAVVGGWIAGVVPWPVAMLLIVREGVVALGAGVVAMRRIPAVSVRKIGKAATLAVYTAVGAFYMYAGTDLAVFDWLSWIFVVPGLALYYLVTAQYAVDVRRAMASADVSSAQQERSRGSTG